jgi:hypothetical protein
LGIGSLSIGGFLHDAGYVLRTLRRRPLSAVVIVATLAIGVDANIAIFSFVTISRALVAVRGRQWRAASWLFGD